MTIYPLKIAKSHLNDEGARLFSEKLVRILREMNMGIF